MRGGVQNDKVDNFSNNRKNKLRRVMKQKFKLSKKKCMYDLLGKKKQKTKNSN